MSSIEDRVERVAGLQASLAASGVGGSGGSDTGVLQAGLRDVAAIRSWATAAEAVIVRQLEAVSSSPEAHIADASRCSSGAASTTRDRADTLSAAPEFAEALSAGSIVSGHVDELTRAASRLDDAGQRADLFERAEELRADAETSTIDEFRRTLGRAVRNIQRDDGMERLERQRRATTMSTWVDAEGMWNLRARFDPLTGVSLHGRIEQAVQALFAERVPESCPTDPVQKQKHLRAIALARLIADDVAAGFVSAVPAGARHGSGAGSSDGPKGPDGPAGSDGPAGPSTTIGERARRSGRPEFVAVIDVDRPDGAGGCAVDWGIGVEVPAPIIAEMIGSGGADVSAVVVRNGVVIHAPGALDLGRSARHASRAQRRALRALYDTCAIPGCRTHFDRCKMHHIRWWSHGGTTDLDNLLPLCVQHHHRVHDDGWNVELGSNRRLNVALPDGNVMTTGPPTRLTG